MDMVVNCIMSGWRRRRRRRRYTTTGGDSGFIQR